MASLLLMGDLKIIGKDLYNYFNEMHLQPHLINFVHPNDFNKFNHPKKHNIDFRDFHTLTIEIFDINPEILVYIPPYRMNWIAEQFPDYAEISNSEAVLHLIETLEQFQSHFLLISSDLVTCSEKDFSKPSIVGTTLKVGESYLESYKKSTIIRPGFILNSSEFGILSWIKSNPNFQDRLIQTFDIGEFNKNLVKIFVEKIYRNVNLVSEPHQLSSLKEISLNYSNIQVYKGSTEAFGRKFCILDPTIL